MDKEKIKGSFSAPGLTSNEVKQRQQQFGINEIRTKQVNFFRSMLGRLWNPISWLLEVAILLEILYGKQIQAIFVLILLLFSAIDGQVMENKAKKSLKIVKDELENNFWVKRDNYWQLTDSRNLVPEDIILLHAGEMVPADAKILVGEVVLDESSITGESNLNIRTKEQQILSGSIVRKGEIIGKITAIGKNSRLGRTLNLIKENESPGRLQNLLFTVVKYLAIMDSILAILLVLVALTKGAAISQLFPFLVILFVATIPISMPSSFTVANSYEAGLLAKKGIYITGLTGIQAAANMDVFLIDKTGTLTNSQTKIEKVVPFNKLSELKVTAFLVATTDPVASDPISQAVKEYLVDRQFAKLVLVKFEAFSAERKYSSALLNDGQQILFGSPLLLKSQNVSLTLDERQQIEVLNQKGKKYLVLVSIYEKASQLLGIVIMTDEIRTEASRTIAALKQLHIRPILLTGDTVESAVRVSSAVGIGKKIVEAQGLADIEEVAGFANVLPEDKLSIVKRYQENGHVVGMLGDGINDAPALKVADLGVAVKNATDVAKLAAKAVLSYPELEDIVEIVKSGHNVYRRMMTWTITKLSRTAQLATLLTLGYLFSGFFPVSLNLIVFIVILNDCVTLVLGTDNTVANLYPEKWDLSRLLKISLAIAMEWIVLGLSLFFGVLYITKLSIEQISTLMYVFLMLSALMTILVTRTQKNITETKPSHSVMLVIFLDVLVVLLMALFGEFTAAIPWKLFIGVASGVLLNGLVVNEIKKIVLNKRE